MPSSTMAASSRFRLWRRGAWFRRRLAPQAEGHSEPPLPAFSKQDGDRRRGLRGSDVLTSLDKNLYEVSATAMALSQTERRVATLSDLPVWQLTPPEPFSITSLNRFSTRTESFWHSHS